MAAVVILGMYRNGFTNRVHATAGKSDHRRRLQEEQLRGLIIRKQAAPTSTSPQTIVFEFLVSTKPTQSRNYTCTLTPKWYVHLRCDCCFISVWSSEGRTHRFAPACYHQSHATGPIERFQDWQSFMSFRILRLAVRLFMEPLQPRTAVN